jgi:hypothetical protein
VCSGDGVGVGVVKASEYVDQIPWPCTDASTPSSYPKGLARLGELHRSTSGVSGFVAKPSPKDANDVERRPAAGTCF